MLGFVPLAQGREMNNTELLLLKTHSLLGKNRKNKFGKIGKSSHRDIQNVLGDLRGTANPG